MTNLITKYSHTPSELITLCEKSQLYAVFDVCDDASLQELADELSPTMACSLFENWPEQVQVEIAPRLVIMEEPIVKWLLATTKPWGVFIVADLSLQELQRHLKKFLKVVEPADEGDDQVYFRFYDPRLLPKFLEVCSESELNRFFGKVVSFGVNSTFGGCLFYRRTSPGTYSRNQNGDSSFFRMRREHYTAMETITFNLLKDRIQAHVKINHASAITNWTDNDLQLFLSKAISRAQSRYGFTSEYHLTLYCVLSLEIGPRFDDDQKVRRILLEETAHPETGLELLQTEMTEADWKQALKMSLPSGSL